MDGGAWSATVRGVAKSRTRLRTSLSLFISYPFSTYPCTLLSAFKIIKSLSSKSLNYFNFLKCFLPLLFESLSALLGRRLFFFFDCFLCTHLLVLTPFLPCSSHFETVSVRCPPYCSSVNDGHCLPSSLNLPALNYMPLNYTTSVLSRLPPSTGSETRSLSPVSFIMLLLFTCWVLSSFLRLHRLWDARLLCSPLSPWASSNSCSLSQWCYATISSSATSFSSCLQSFSASGSFPVSQLFPSGGRSIGGSASAAVLPKNIKGWFPLGLTSLISLQSQRLSRVFSNTTVWNHQFFSTQPSLWSSSQSVHSYWKKP